MLDDTTQDASEAPVSNEAQAAGLSIQDLRIFKEIVDVASARGAFKADEFSAIGDTYNRLNTFLAQIDVQNAPAEEEEEANTEATDELEETTEE
jgi:hypothetical protein